MFPAGFERFADAGKCGQADPYRHLGFECDRTYGAPPICSSAEGSKSVFMGQLMGQLFAGW